MAGKQKAFDQETRQKIESTLDNLPEKPKSERPLTTQQLVAELRPKIKAAQAKGYTLEEIVDLFKQSGAQISLSSVKSALRTTTRSKPKAAAANGAPPDGSKG